MSILLENRQEAESFLKKNNIETNDPKYIKLRELLQKNPSYLGVMTKLVMGGHIELNQVKEILNSFDLYKNDFKLDKVNPQMLLVNSLKQNNPLEFITDQIDITEVNSLTREFISSIQHSNVRKDLRGEYFNNIRDGIISLRGVKNWSKQLEFISKKSAAMRNGKDVVDIFNNLVRNAMGGFSSESISKRIKETSGAVEIFNQDGFVVAMIFTFNASKSLGSSSWCISRYDSYYNSYASNRQQLFIWDTSKSPSSNDSLLGVTVNQNGSVNTSHKKNDNYFDSKAYFSKIGNTDLYNVIFKKVSQRSPKVAMMSTIYNNTSVDIRTLYNYVFTEFGNQNITLNSVIDILSIIIRTTISKYRYDQIFTDNEVVSNSVKFNEMIYEVKQYFNSLDLSNMNIENLFTSINSIRSLKSVYVYRYILSDIESNPTFNKLSYNDQKTLEILRNLEPLDARHDYIIPLKFREDSPNTTIHITEKEIEIKDGIYTKYTNLFKLLEKITYSEKLKVVINANDLLIDFKNIDVNVLGYNINSDKLTLDNLSQGTNGRFKGSIKELILRNSKLTNKDYVNIKGLKSITKIQSTILKTELSMINNIDTLSFIKCNLDKNIVLPSNINTLVLKYSLFDLKNLNNVNVNKIICTDEFLFNLSDDDKKYLEDKNIEVEPLPGLVYESLSSELLTKLYKILKDKKKLSTFFNILSNMNIDISKIDDSVIEYKPSIYIRKLKKDTTPNKESKLVIGVDLNGNINHIFILSYSSKTYYSRGYKSTYSYKPEIRYFDEKGNIESVDKISMNNKNKAILKNVEEDNDVLIVLDLMKIFKDDNLRNTELRDGRKSVKKDSPHFMTYTDHQNDLQRRKEQYIKDKFKLSYKNDEKTIDFVSFILNKTLSVYNLYYERRTYTNTLNNIIKYVDVYNNGDKEDKLSDISNQISDNLSRFISNNKIPNYQMVENIYLQCKGGKVTFNPNKLKEFSDLISDINHTLREDIKKVSNLEYIDDIKLIKFKLDLYHSIIFKDNMMFSRLSQMSSKNLNFQSNYRLHKDIRDILTYAPNTFKTKSQEVGREKLDLLMDEILKELRESSRKVRVISKI